jgi:hypothetical protein
MRIDPDTCRDPDLLASEVRRLQGVIAASKMEEVSQNSDCPAPDNAANADKTIHGAAPAAWQLWGDESDDGPFDHYITERSAHWDAERLRHENPAKKWFVVPLYRLPTLTNEEREAVSRAYDVLYERAGQLQATGNIAASTPFVQSAKALQRLWARQGGER